MFSTDIKVPASINVPVQDATGAVLGVQPTATGALAGTRLQFVDMITAPGTRNTDQSSFTEELQFQGRIGGDRFVWQAGGYYEGSVPNRFVGTSSTQLTNCTNIALEQCHSPIGEVYRQGYIQFYSNLYHLPASFLASALPSDFPIGGAGLRLGKISYSNLGIYGQATYALTSKLKLTGGIRYTSDIVRNSAEDFTYTFPQANNGVISCIEPDANLANNCLLKVKEKSAKPTGLVDLDYKPNDDILIYVKYSRGYRQGSISPDARRVSGPLVLKV